MGGTQHQCLSTMWITTAQATVLTKHGPCCYEVSSQSISVHNHSLWVPRIVTRMVLTVDSKQLKGSKGNPWATLQGRPTCGVQASSEAVHTLKLGECCCFKQHMLSQLPSHFDHDLIISSEVGLAPTMASSITAVQLSVNQDTLYPSTICTVQD